MKKMAIEGDMSDSRVPSSKERYRIGVLTSYPTQLFKDTIGSIEERGHIADIIEWSRLAPSINSNGIELGYQGNLKVKSIRDYDIIFNHFCGFRSSYYYSVFRALCGSAIINDWEGVVCASDKFKTLVRAASQGVSVPDTVLLNNANFDIGIAEAEKRINYPMVMKELYSDNGEKVFLVRSRREAWQIWNEAELDDLFLLQNFEHGDHLRVVVLGDRVLYSVKNRIAPGDFRGNVAYSTGAELFNLTNSEKGQMVNVAQALGLDFVGLDVIKRADSLCLLEANAKPGLQYDMQVLAPLSVNPYRELGAYLLERAKAYRSCKVNGG